MLQNHISPAVVNLSYGDDGSTGGSFAVLQALQSLADNGVVVVVLAGNHNRDAYLWRANRVSPGLVVAAAGWLSFDQSIYRMAYSNFGSTVDLFAPGDGTYAAINASSQAFGTFGGTSGASPFVAGAVAQILEAYPSLSPADVEYWIKANSTPGVISGTMPGDPNLFLSRW